MPNAAVKTALDEAYPGAGLALMDVTTSNVFPQGFPRGYHPILATTTYNTDIRMSALQIDGALFSTEIYAPYVSSQGQGPVSASLVGYMAGGNSSLLGPQLGPLVAGLVPTIANPLLFGGTPLRLGKFIPADAAYAINGNSLSTETKWAFVPNPASGPGVYPEVVDMIFNTARSPMYSDHTFKSLINQPILEPSGRCQRNQYYFNNATAMPELRQGNVTLGPGASGGPISGAADALLQFQSPNSTLMKASPDGKTGIYTGLTGYTACAQNVGFNIEDCGSAVRNVDPASLR